MAGTHSIDDLRAGAGVHSSDGKKLGKLFAVVVDPRDNRVTHLAIDAGPHFPKPGFGSPKIVSVDIDQLLKADRDSIALELSEDAFRSLPLYEHQHFFEIPKEEQTTDDGTPNRLWNVGVAIAAALAGLATGLAVPAEHFAKASFERHILDDAPVWRDDPNTHIGDIERVLIDDETNVMVGLVIRRGVLFHEEVVLPMKHVKEIRDGSIIVQLSDEDIERLAPSTG